MSYLLEQNDDERFRLRLKVIIYMQLVYYVIDKVY